jgi:hypothetical protein
MLESSFELQRMSLQPDQKELVSVTDLIINSSNCQGHFHTWDWELLTIALLALSLVENAEPVQVRYFTLSYAWGTNGVSECCKVDVKVYVDFFYMASNGSCFITVTWTILKNHLLEVGLRQNRETMAHDHGIMNVQHRWFILLYCVWGPTWIESHWSM